VTWQDLGIHTEMFSDGILPLVRNGNINNARKVRIHVHISHTGNACSHARLLEYRRAGDDIRTQS
jgi:acyl-CoA hydrolase